MKKKFVQDYKRKEYGQQFVYVGDYYIFSMEEAEKKKHCVFQFLFAVFQILLLIAAGVLNSPGSYKIYIVLPYLFMILPLLYYIMGTAGFARVPERMEKIQYEKSIFRMLKSVAAMFFLSIFTVCADAIFFLSKKSEIRIMPEALFLGIMILLTGMNFAAFRYHCKMQKSVRIEQQKKKDTKDTK